MVARNPNEWNARKPVGLVSGKGIESRQQAVAVGLDDVVLIAKVQFGLLDFRPVGDGQFQGFIERRYIVLLGFGSESVGWTEIPASSEVIFLAIMVFRISCCCK